MNLSQQERINQLQHQLQLLQKQQEASNSQTSSKSFLGDGWNTAEPSKRPRNSPNNPTPSQNQVKLDRYWQLFHNLQRISERSSILRKNPQTTPIYVDKGSNINANEDPK